MSTLTYNGKKFNQREDGFVNLGQLCSTHGKRFSNWIRLENSKEYLASLAESLTESGTQILTPDELVVSAVNNIGGDAGTWGHPLVAIEVARWISPAFGVWCNTHIKTLIETGKTELISQPQHKIPLSYGEALLEAGRLAMENERLEAEKKLLEEENLKLAEAVDELFDYSSIIRIAKFNKVSEKNFCWRKLKAASLKMGKEIKQVPDPRFETKNLYAHDVWRVCYPAYRLPETTTLVIAH